MALLRLWVLLPALLLLGLLRDVVVLHTRRPLFHQRATTNWLLMTCCVAMETNLNSNATQQTCNKQSTFVYQISIFVCCLSQKEKKIHSSECSSDASSVADAFTARSSISTTPPSTAASWRAKVSAFPLSTSVPVLLSPFAGVEIRLLSGSIWD